MPSLILTCSQSSWSQEDVTVWPLYTQSLHLFIIISSNSRCADSLLYVLSWWINNWVHQRWTGLSFLEFPWGINWPLVFHWLWLHLLPLSPNKICGYFCLNVRVISNNIYYRNKWMIVRLTSVFLTLTIWTKWQYFQTSKENWFWLKATAPKPFDTCVVKYLWRQQNHILSWEGSLLKIFYPFILLENNHSGQPLKLWTPE